MSISIGVAIIGGTGYGAGELLRIFTQHPHVEVVSVVSQSRAGTPIADAHPNLSGFYDGVFEASVDFEALSKYQFGAVFLGLPHGTSAARVQKILPALEAHNLHLFDMSGDFRLRNESIRSQFYPEASVPQELQERFVYGLAELNRESIRSARFLSIPGCLAATCELAALPLIDSEFSGSIVFDVKTGTSGAGRSPNSSFHHPSRFGNMNPYKVFSHRHEPEICQTLGDPKSERLTVSFVPHVIPISRGVYTSMYLTLPRAESGERLLDEFRDYYRDAPFIRIRPNVPDLQAVVGTNFCDISVVTRGKQVAVFAAMDNLGKGTAGQAVQNLNLVADIPETTGLWSPSTGPA